MFPVSSSTALREAAIGTAAAASQKMVGSVFRIKDDWHAPSAVRKATVERETLLLGESMVFTAALTPIFTRALPGLIGKSAKGMRGNVAAAITGLSLAEITSRMIAAKPKWQDKAAMMSLPAEEHDHFDDDEYDNLGRRLDMISTSRPSKNPLSFSQALPSASLFASAAPKSNPTQNSVSPMPGSVFSVSV